MKNAIWLLVSVVCLSAGTYLIAFNRDEPPKSAPVNRVVVANPVVDLGQIRQGTTHTATFRLANKRQVPVVLEQRWASCDCTELRLPTDPVPPGGDVDIPMTWRVGAHRGLCGSRVVLAALSGDDDSPEQLVVRIQAEVVPDVGLSPKDVAFTRGVAATMEVTVGPVQAGAAIESVGSPSAFLQASFDPDRQVIVLRYDAAKDPQDQDWLTLDVRTSSKNEPAIRYTVWLADGDGPPDTGTPR